MEDSPQLNELVKQLTSAFNQSRNGTDQKLEELSKALTQIVPDIKQLQRDVLIMQGDMRTRYVSREEYEPRHQALIDKTRQYDAIIAASQPARDSMVRMDEAIKNLEKADQSHATDLTELEKRFRGLGQRAIPWISAALAGVAVLLTFLSHVSFR